MPKSEAFYLNELGLPISENQPGRVEAHRGRERQVGQLAEASPGSAEELRDPVQQHRRQAQGGRRKVGQVSILLWAAVVAQRQSTCLQDKTFEVVGSIPNRCWALFFSFYPSVVHLLFVSLEEVQHY